MSKISSPYGKPLKGISNASAASGGDIATSVINSISNGAVTMNNIDIAGGTINNVTIGIDGPGPILGTTIITGAPNGSGYDIIFYGDTVGEYASWLATLGLFNISGDLLVTGITDLGNIRIAGNTISSTNTNGSIIIDPAGTGCLLINSCVHQNSTIGNVTFNVVDGIFNASSTGNSGLTSTAGKINLNSKNDTSITSSNGTVSISSGTSKDILNITSISTGTQPGIITSSPHLLEVGDKINFTGTNSSPPLLGEFTVTQVVDSTTFKITPGFTIFTSGSAGSFTKDADIYLNTPDAINIPNSTELTFGGDLNYIRFDTDLDITSSNALNLTGSSVNIPDTVSLNFGTNSITSVGTSLIVESTELLLNSNNVKFKDPIIKLDSNVHVANNNKDKGIEFNYFDTSSKLGWFGYDNSTGSFSFFKNATNTGEVISGTLGNVSFNTGLFQNLNVGTIDACNINCPGLMTLTGGTGIRLSTPVVTIPQGSDLKFGDTGNTVIKKEASGIDLLIQSQGHVFLTPGSSSFDVILPIGSGLVLNGEGGSQNIKSISTTELSISSSSFLNLNQISGGVRLTEELPLILNQDETTYLLGDSAGNLLVNSGGSINLLPLSGQVSIPVNKRLELGSSTSYIGTTALNTVVLSTPGTIGVSSTGNQTFTTSGNINLSPTGSVILPINKAIQLGGSTETIKSDSSGNLLYSSSGSQSVISGGSINLTPTVSVNIPYTKPLTFGSNSESISGTSGNLLLTAGTSTVSGNFIVNGGVTNINSNTVTFNDPILTLSNGTSISDDNKDRGIEYKYFSSSLKLGFFGVDDTDNTFTFIPDATNTGEVISGALGNVKFSGGSFTGLNLNNGTISNVNTITSANDLTLQSGPGKDIILNVDSGRNVVIPVNVDLLFGGETNKIYSDGTDLHIVDSLVVDGSTVVNGDLTVTGNVNITGGTTINFTTHRFSVIGGGTAHPNSSSNATFITVSSAGVASGTLPSPALDGFVKNICIVSLASGGSYELIFPTGRLLDPGTGTTVAKKMLFDCPGQSVQLVWDNSSNFYIMTQGGGDLVLL